MILACFVKCFLSFLPAIIIVIVIEENSLQIIGKSRSNFRLRSIDLHGRQQQQAVVVIIPLTTTIMDKKNRAAACLKSYMKLTISSLCNEK